MREELLLQSRHVRHTTTLLELVVATLTLVASATAVVVLAGLLTTCAVEAFVLLATSSLLLITLAAATGIVGSSWLFTTLSLSFTVALRLVLETWIASLLFILLSATLCAGSTSLVGHPWLIVMLN